MKCTTRRIRSTFVIAPALAAILLAGCSSDDEPDDSGLAQSEDSEASSQGSDTAEQSADTGQPVGNLDEAPALEESVGARREARFEDCALEAGDVTVPGQVTNSQDEPQNYVVSVSWIVEGSQVIARGVTEVEEVPADETVQFEITAELESDAQDCTYNVRRAPTSENS